MRWTGVEVTRLVASQRDKLLNLKEETRKNVLLVKMKLL